MKTVRRMLYRDIVSSVAFVALAFLSLSFFIDFVDELQKIGRPGFTLWFAVGGALLELPGNLYELLPIAVLIGTDLFDGPAGADLGVHDPAHRRPEPAARTAAAGRCWLWSSAR